MWIGEGEDELELHGKAWIVERWVGRSGRLGLGVHDGGKVEEIGFVDRRSIPII